MSLQIGTYRYKRYKALQVAILNSRKTQYASPYHYTTLQSITLHHIPTPGGPAQLTKPCKTLSG